MIAADAEHRCAFSIFGEDEHPHNTRRPAQVLAFASAYLELLERFAADRDEPIEFEGIALTDNCITAETRVSDPVAGRRASWAANQAIKDPEAYQPRGVSPLIATCRDLGRRFGQPARISIGIGWSELVEYQTADDAPWEAMVVGPNTRPAGARIERTAKAWRAEHGGLVDAGFAITQQRARADKAAGLAREVQALLALAAEHGVHSRRRRIVPRHRRVPPERRHS